MNDPVYFAEKYCKVISLDQGLVPFNLYPYQRKMFKQFQEHRFNVVLACRQSGKSISACAYLLWFALFHSEKTVAVLANKGATAREMLSRVTLMLENIPFFLQPGTKALNKGSLEFSNNSRIIAAATSGSSIRGLSVNLLYLDEFAFVERAAEFYTSTYPVVSSGKDTKIIVTSTANGIGNTFYKIWEGATQGVNEFKPFRVDWWDVPGRDKEWKEQTIRNTSADQFRVEFECEFIGSSNTLISPSVLKRLVYKQAQFSNEHTRIYKKPEEGHTYFAMVDTARGVNNDYSTIVVVDTTELPNEVVAVYQDNKISPYNFPTVIAQFHKEYNNAYMLVESNDIGMTVVETLHNELELDNVLMSAGKGRAGQVLSSGFGSGSQYFGVRTTKQVKRVGCLNLKTLIENDQLFINDFKILDELTHFVQKAESYEAEGGNHDDLVMCLVLFGWLSNQEHYKELSNSDIRKHLVNQQSAHIEQDLLPFGVTSMEADYNVPDGYAEEASW
jgi:hypothetical protein